MFKRTGRTIRIALSNQEKELIHEYWYVATKSIKVQLTNKRRKTVDITDEEIKDLVGFLSLECNHCKSKRLSISVEKLPPVSVQKFPHGLVGYSVFNPDFLCLNR